MSDYSNINNYVLKDDIGEGNFGKVKIGIFKQTGEEFAVKILNKKKIKIKMKNTVFKENEIITKFNHVNVIFVFDIIEDQDNFYIVMEYCKSGELFDYIVEHQHLEEDEAAIFFYQLINGVEYIHSLGVAHRDLKPENLLLTENKILKIIDFGLSHEFNGEDFLKTKCGSPSYAAPEIIKGLPYDGFKTDIWCCGIILYAMVCGYLPFEGENNKILFKSIVECNPEIPEYLNEDTQDLISAILRPNPDDRITIEEIKKHDFYLRGKELCDIDYSKLQRMLNKKRQNMSNNNYLNNIDKRSSDVEFINQKINITIDNDDMENCQDIIIIDKNKKDKENKENADNNNDINKNDNEDNVDIVIKSINEISSSKITNNSKYDNNNIINKKPKEKNINIKNDEEKNKERRRRFQFLNKKPGLNAFRDKIFALNKNFNKKIENFNNNMNLILNTDANAIVNNKINKNPIYNSKVLNININKKNNNNNINNNDYENNTNNVNTISSTINGNQKSNYINTNYYNNAVNTNDTNNDKKSILLDNISTNSKSKINQKLIIQEKDKNRIIDRKLKDNNFYIINNLQNKNNKKIDFKYNITLNCFNRRVQKNDFKNNIIKVNNNNIINQKNNNIKNNINIINNTINNYGTLNILSTANNNNNNILHNNKSTKKTKIYTDKNEKIKTETNTFNAIREMIFKNKKRANSSYKMQKINQNNNINKYYNIKLKDYHSVKSSNSGSTKNNRSNTNSNSKSYKNKNNKNSSNNTGNVHYKGFRIKTNKLNNISNHNIITNVNNINNNYLQYPRLNIGNKLFLEKDSHRGVSNNIKYKINNNQKYTSISGKNSNRNKIFYKRNNVNNSENRIINKKIYPKNNSNENKKNKKNKKECINYFNALSTMFMKTENNFNKNKGKISNANSVNSRVSKNSKNSKNSKATSKNSKSSKSSKSSKKKYNLIRRAIKHQMGNFIFNKKGGSEGKTNRFIQHSKLFSIHNNLKNNKNNQNINNILDNCMGINNNFNNNNYLNCNNLNNNNKINSNRGYEVNNIKIIKPKGSKSKKIMYNQVNFENIKNIYILNSKNKKKLPFLNNKDI